MSSRALRKLQGRKKKDIDDAYLDDDDSSKEEESDDKEVIQIKDCNRFDLLIGGSPSESEAKEDDGISEAKEDDGILDCDGNVSHKIKQNKECASGARKKKKMKKRRGYNKYPASSEDQMDFDHDEVERSVREVNAILGEARQPATSCSVIENTGKKNLLAVEHKYLNPQNEMKRIFGSRVVQSADAHKKRNARVGNSRFGRGTWIIQGQSNWNHVSKLGVSMVLVESSSNYHVFKYQHSTTYQQVQFKFLEAVETLNPDNILALLHSDPFHVDTLLQVAEIFRLADDSAMSSQFIERAIYVLESVSHPLFNFTQCNSRLLFKQQENRCFFIAIFRHILNVGLKGCYRTALELCKLLLGLSPDEDPMAISLMLDFYALRSQEYAWLIAFYDLYEPIKNYSLLPNFAFSVPLALFHLSESESGLSAATNDRTERGKKQVIFNNLGSPVELRQRADEMLLAAIIMFPGVLRPLLEKCNIQPDVNIDDDPYFGIKSEQMMPKGLSQLVKLFVARNYHVWKEPDVMVWLETIFKLAMKRVELGDSLVSECEEKRKLRYQGTPVAINRHIIVSEIKEVTVDLPPSQANIPVMSFDPLPPNDSICDYIRPNASSIPASSSSAILASFFRGLLPSYDPQRELAAVPNEDELESAGAELRASVNTLLETMRNLFNNISINETGGDEASDENDDTWN